MSSLGLIYIWTQAGTVFSTELALTQVLRGNSSWSAWSVSSILMALALTELLLALILGIYFVGGGNASYCVLLQSSCRMKVDKANFTVFNQLMAFFRQGKQLMEESEEEVETELCGRELERE